MSKIVWNIDPTHSEVQFKVKHLVISTVTGSFKSFSGGIETEGEIPLPLKAHFEADVDSIFTNQEQRDGHLKSADFFDAANHPKLSFDSTEVKDKGKGEFVLKGFLTIKGTKQEVELEAVYGGTMTDPYGNVKSGYEINGAISRKEFGLNWSAVTEAGGVVVGDEVKLHLNIQVTKV